MSRFSELMITLLVGLAEATSTLIDRVWNAREREDWLVETWEETGQ